MKLYFMPSSTGRLTIPDIPKTQTRSTVVKVGSKHNCKEFTQHSNDLWNYDTDASICVHRYHSPTRWSHSKHKAAGTVCYSEVTYHSNSRYKKDRNMGGWKWRKDEAALTPAQHQIRRAMKFSCMMQTNHMINIIKHYAALRSIWLLIDQYSIMASKT